MTFWTALMFVGLGVLLRMAFERPRPNRFKDVDALARRHRDYTFRREHLNHWTEQEPRSWGMWSL